MNQQRAEWRERIDEVDARLIDEFQSGFPITEHPFRVVGEQLGVSEADALARVEELLEAGVLRRFGTVLNPPAIGASALAAIRAPEDRFAECAAIVNEYRQVNHNYRRDHEWNMWFVVTAGSLATRDRVLDEIEARTECEVLRLPMHTDFYINLEFPVVNTDRFARESTTTDASIAGSGDAADSTTEQIEPTEATHIAESASTDLSELEARLLLAIQEGLPLTATPYCDLAAEIDAEVRDVLDAIERLLDRGAIKRVGCVVNHVATGFDANCMVVWDVPDADLEASGKRAGALPYVTLCYHRPRRPDHDWPYNLFTMIHGRDRDTVDAKIDELAADYLPVSHERLRSTETLKQTGARYDALLDQSAE